MRLVFATNNEHKLAEVRQILGSSVEIVSLGQIGCHDDIPETSDTLEGNALQKARYVHDRYGVDCFADDTGLEVAALGGAPGVRSARYAGEGHDSAANRRKLLASLAHEADRRADFRTVVALIMDGETHLFEGRVDGRIAEAEVGEGGFGYDSLFVPDGEERTFAQLSSEEKNAMSHRGRAVKSLADFLKKRTGEQRR